MLFKSWHAIEQRYGPRACTSRDQPIKTRHLAFWLSTLLLFFILSLSALIGTQAQARGIYISAENNHAAVVSVGDELSFQALAGGSALNGVVMNPYFEWRAEPAGRVLFLSSTRSEPGDGGVRVRFITAGTVTITASGFDESNDPEPSDIPGFNQLQLGFLVSERSTPGSDTSGTPLSSSDTTSLELLMSEQTISSLNHNQRSTLTGVISACSSMAQRVEKGDVLSAAQQQLNRSCSTLFTGRISGTTLNSLAAEELLVLDTLLTRHRHHHNSQIQTRIERLRKKQAQRVDLSGLNVRIGDQHIHGSILTAAFESLQQRTFSEQHAQATGAWHKDDTMDPSLHRSYTQSNTIILPAIKDASLNAFASGTLASGTIDGDTLETNADLDYSGITLGADYRLRHNRLIGASLGVAGHRADVRNEGGTVTLDTLNATLYNSWYQSDAGYADIVADLGIHTTRTQRRIHLTGTSAESGTGKTGALSAALSISAGRNVQYDHYSLEPSFYLSMMHTSVDGYTERSSLNAQNGSGMTLSIHQYSAISVKLGLGLNMSRVISTRFGVLTPSLSARYEIEARPDSNDIVARFTHAPDAEPMRLRGLQRDTRTLQLGLASTFVLMHGHSGFISYDTLLQHDNLSEQRLSIGYRILF